jgi:retinol dehydrogenase-12
MHFSFFQFIKDQRNPVPSVVQADLAGKTVIVTGANSGIGFEAAKHFARMNPGRLILACKSKERGEAALKSESKDLFIWLCLILLYSV